MKKKKNHLNYLKFKKPQLVILTSAGKCIMKKKNHYYEKLKRAELFMLIVNSIEERKQLMKTIITTTIHGWICKTNK